MRGRTRAGWQVEKLEGECKMGPREHPGPTSSKAKFLGLERAGMGSHHLEGAVV